MSSDPTPSEWKKKLLTLLRRSNLLVFVLIGGVVFLAREFVGNALIREVLLQFGTTFAAVALVSYVWAFLGGPPERQVLDDLSSLKERVDALRQSLPASFDGLAVGVERMWETRRVWEVDQNEGLAVWKQRVVNARRVDIASITFSTWMRDHRFLDELFANMDRGAVVRIVIFDPKGHARRERAADEEDPSSEMEIEIESTLQKLARWRERMTRRENLKVGLTTRFVHYAQIVRADDRMLVTSYLSGSAGSPAPTSQLRGDALPYFTTYAGQFERLWKRAQELTDADFARIHKDKMPGAPAPDASVKG